MPPPRFTHGYAHDVFVSYTHTDDQPDPERRWVSEFVRALRTRLEIVSGHTVDIWRDEEKLGAADLFNEAIHRAIDDSAVLVVVLSPGYFNSQPCGEERDAFAAHVRRENKETIAGKSRVVKVVKFPVAFDKYPADLRDLLEHRFYTEVKGVTRVKELRLSDEPWRHDSKVDDVAQEIAELLALLESEATPVERKGAIYLAEATLDLDAPRDELRRSLTQAGYDVFPKTELGLLRTRDAIERFVDETMRNCRLAVHPVGAYFGFVPEGASGRSVVEIQLERAKASERNGDFGRIIWVPEGLVPQEDTQKQFLERLRTQYSGHGFELVEQPLRKLSSHVQDRLKGSMAADSGHSAAASSVYLVCDGLDRGLAKSVRSFLYSQNYRVEWTPLTAGDLANSSEHMKLLQRNSVHVVLHGETSEGWLQDRVRELADVGPSNAGRKAVYLAAPRRQDKDDFEALGVDVLHGYPPATVGATLEPFLRRLLSAGGSS